MTTSEIIGVGESPARRIAADHDPKFGKLLGAAVAGNADLIVGGDNDLLVLSPFTGIPIFPPHAILRMLDLEQRQPPTNGAA